MLEAAVVQAVVVADRTAKATAFLPHCLNDPAKSWQQGDGFIKKSSPAACLLQDDAEDELAIDPAPLTKTAKPAGPQ
jgi:hypothetical protein